MKRHFAVSIDEASLHAARYCEHHRVADHIRAHNPLAAQRVRSAIYDSLQHLIMFPNVGRRQNTEGVRKLVTRKYSYLVYYTIDEGAEEVVILNIKHPAQRREHSDL